MAAAPSSGETTASGGGCDDSSASTSTPPDVLANGADGPAIDDDDDGGGAVLLPMFLDGEDGDAAGDGSSETPREGSGILLNCLNSTTNVGDGTATAATEVPTTAAAAAARSADYGLFEIEEEELELQDCLSTLALNSDDEEENENEAGRWGDSSTLEPGSSGRNLAQSRTNTDAAVMATALAIQRSHSSSNLLLMKRVGSCFFSVDGGSTVASDAGVDTTTHAGQKLVTTASSSSSDGDLGGSNSPLLGTEVEVEVEVRWNAVDVLYHDVMMNVLSFLPGRDLASFSETARRPNFDCFYYLQLQLERALLVPPQTTGRSQNQTRGVGEGSGPSERRSSAATSIAAAFSSSPPSSSSTCPIAVCGAGILSRLNSVDRSRAQELVSEYRDSVDPDGARGDDTHAHHGPDALLRLREKFSSATPKEKGAACTFAFTMLGAAASRAAQSCHEASSCGVPSIEGIPGGPGAALLGFAGLAVASRCAYAAKARHDDERNGDGDGHLHDNDNGASPPSSNNNNLPNPAAAMARKMQEMLMTLPIEGEGEGVFPAPIAHRLRRFREMCHHAGGSDAEDDGNSTGHGGKRRRGKRSKKCGGADEDPSPSNDDDNYGDDYDTDDEDEDRHDEYGRDEFSLLDDFEEGPFSPDPYEHCGVNMCGEPGDAADDDVEISQARATSPSAPPRPNFRHRGDGDSDHDHEHELHQRRRRRRNRQRQRHRRSRKKPIGCVGAYARVLRRSTEAVTELVRTERREAFSRLSEAEKIQATTAFIDACASDANFNVVRDLVRDRGVDVDGFYVGSDGTTETCGLHAAAFNGSGAVLEFLCSGVDELDPTLDGGMCDVDLCDANGWTALHFAAGADNVDAVVALASRGANLTVEASNGYTPYHWSERLSNDAVAAELRRLGADDRFLEFRRMFGGRGGGGGRTQPLSFLANRFFSLIPTN